MQLWNRAARGIEWLTGDRIEVESLGICPEQCAFHQFVERFGSGGRSKAISGTGSSDFGTAEVDYRSEPEIFQLSLPDTTQGVLRQYAGSEGDNRSGHKRDGDDSN